MMSQPIEQGVQSFSHLVTAADLSTKQYYFVKMSSGNVALNDTAGGPCLGILRNKPGSGVAAEVVYGGIVPCVAGGSVTAGNRIKSDADGKGVAASAAVVNTNDGGSTTDPVIGSNVMGIALSDAASGEQFNLLVLPGGAIPTTAA